MEMKEGSSDPSLFMPQINKGGPPGLQYVCYLFVHWNPFRALFRPYFFLSFSRGSRVKRPSFLRGSRSSSLKETSAREMPWRMAPACPENPPPCALATISHFSWVFATSRGLLTWSSQTFLPKYSSIGFSFICMLPLPGISHTRAIAVFLLPVA